MNFKRQFFHHLLFPNLFTKFSLSEMHQSRSPKMEEYSKPFESNIQKTEVDIFDVFDLQYQPGADPFDFYNEYRKLIIANLMKKGDVILWQESRLLDADEEISPTFEIMILANVLGLIDTRLTGLVREKYRPLIGRTKSLMDYRMDILGEIFSSLSQMEDNKYKSNIPDLLAR